MIRRSRPRPERNRRFLAAVMATVLTLVVAGCGDDGEAVDLASSSVTTAAASTTTTTTTTTTSLPSAAVTGRVFLVDRDTGVPTTVDLMLGEDSSDPVDSTESNADGSFTFVVTEPGEYSVRVSLTRLVDMCDNLRSVAPTPEGFTSSGWPVTIRKLDQGGVTDVLAGSASRPLEVGTDGPMWAPLGPNPAQTEWVNDLVLNCD